VLLKAKVDKKAHIVKVQKLMMSTASCDSIKSTIADTELLDMLGIYSAILGPSMLEFLQKDGDVDTLEPEVVSLLDAPVQAARKPAVVSRVFRRVFTTVQGTWCVISGKNTSL
jgi:hypothetical protein